MNRQQITALFMKLIAGDTGIGELTPTILNECVQQIEIIIGSIDLPAIHQPIPVIKSLNEKRA